MTSTCQTCGFDVSAYPAAVEISANSQAFYCPVCGQGFDLVTEVPGKDVFYDPAERSFLKWATPAEAARPEIVETLSLSPQFSLHLRVRPLDYQKLFYSHALVFVVDDEIAQNQLFAPPESCERYGLVITRHHLDQSETFLDLQFELRGASHPFRVTLPATVTRASTGTHPGRAANGSALTVWPNFKRPGWQEARQEGAGGSEWNDAAVERAAVEHGPWRDYFVQFATEDADIRPQSLRLVGEVPGQELTVSGPLLKGALDFPPRYVELKAEVARPGQPPRQYQNCFEVKLNSYEPQPGAAASRTLRLAIDFGTSNTCICYVVPGERGDAGDNTRAPKLLRLRNKNCEVVRGLQPGADPGLLWLPDLDKQEFVPSELVFREEPQKVLARGGLPRPVFDYTIPAARWRAGEEKRICTGFKWKHATEPPAVRDRYEDLQRMYLDLLLRMVAAELVSGDGPLAGSEVHPNRVELVYTYPLAMPKERWEALGAVLEAVGQSVHERTGVEIIVKVGLDESRAGEAAVKMQAEGERIFMDIGGGTTDIAVIEQRNNVATRQLLLVDSMRYAGNDFLAALTHDARGSHISARPLVELQRRVRFFKRAALEDMAVFGGAESRKEKAQAALEAFLLGITQYLARLIVLRLNARGEGDGGPPKKLQLYLLGNGWNFVLFLPRDPLANPNATPKEVMHEEVSRRLYKELDKFRQGKFITLDPPTRWSDLIDINFPQEPKTAVARGALEVTRRHVEGLAKSFVGCDVEIVTAKGLHPFRWDTSLPQEMGVLIDRVSITNPIAGFEELRVPDYQYDHAPDTDLRDIDIKRDVCNERGVLVASAFNVYLERWHKKFLTGDWVTNHQGE